MKRIAIIPARSGSKGLPNKNILMLGDKPLLAYTIEAALRSQCFEHVIVSTDSLEYKSIAEQYGAEVIIREDYLARDTSTTFDVLENIFCEKLQETYDYFVLLQPTSPFRTEVHIQESIALFEEKYQEYNFLVSMEKSNKSAALIKPLGKDGSLSEYKIDFSKYTRQQYQEYCPNGAIFIGKVEAYLLQKHFFGEKSLAYVMTKEDSIDIDDRIDFEMAIALWTKTQKQKVLKQSILQQIEQKEKIFSESKDIALIGHSILANWKIKDLSDYEVSNWGIAGISTEEYQSYIWDARKIRRIPNRVIFMLGTNDIVNPKLSDEEIVLQIQKLVTDVLEKNPRAKAYFLEITSVAFRMDRDKNRIFHLNVLLEKALRNTVQFIKLNETMTDVFGNLKLEYTVDGLHLSQAGYEVLEKIIKKELEI